MRTPCGIGDHVDTVDECLPGVGSQQRRQDAHGGGLAGAVRAEQAVDRTARHLEVDAVERQLVTEIV